MDKFETSLAQGKHQFLNKIAGTYSGSIKTWFEKDQLVDESSITGTIRVILDGRFAVHEYESTFQGKPFKGFTVMGYDLQNDKWQVAWVDSFHMSTGIMFSEGNASDNLNVLGSYGSPGVSERWGWRTEVHQPETSSLIITHYNIAPGEEESLAVEIRYFAI